MVAVQEEISRNLYIPDMVDRAKVVNRAEYLALHDGERVVLHDHAHGQNCAGRCLLYTRSLVVTSWRPDEST